jgi:hypothetical protein
MTRARLLAWSLLVLLAVALVSTMVFDRVSAQADQPPTKEPLQQEPPKPPVEDPPAKAPAEPTSVPPTKAPPAPLPTKALWTNTPKTVLRPTKTLIGMMPTKTALPAATPVSMPATAPTSSVTMGSESRPGDSISATLANSAAQSAETAARATSQPPLIGIVFEDDNRNGVQDENESGLPGIAVIVETPGQQQTLITDSSGAYRVSANPQATVRVVPPAGWQVPYAEALPLDRARNFALRQDTAVSPMPAVPRVTSAVINLTSLALGFVGLGAIIWLGLLQHQRARVTSFNAWARADLRLRSEAERQARRERIVIDEAWIVALLNQAALDATGEAPGIDQIDRVALEPIPALVGLGRDFQRLVFTPAPATIVRQLIKQKALAGLLGDSRRSARMHPIDALNGDLFVTDDLAAALAAKAPRPIVLPRTERWSVYVVPQQRGKVAR